MAYSIRPGGITILRVARVRSVDMFRRWGGGRSPRGHGSVRFGWSADRLKLVGCITQTEGKDNAIPDFLVRDGPRVYLFDASACAGPYVCPARTECGVAREASRPGGEG